MSMKRLHKTKKKKEKKKKKTLTLGDPVCEFEPCDAFSPALTPAAPTICVLGEAIK